LLQAILSQSGAAQQAHASDYSVLGAAPVSAATAGQPSTLEAILDFVAKHPQVITAALALLNPKDNSVGGSNGIAEMQGAFHQAGLGDVIASWIGNGQNQPIDPQSLSGALGSDTMGQFANSAGIEHSQAAPVLASLLPGLVNHLTSKGEIPQGADLDDALTSLMGQLGAK
jgi:uncharacterized protein YidB (DUF937 family)